MSEPHQSPDSDSPLPAPVTIKWGGQTLEAATVKITWAGDFPRLSYQIPSVSHPPRNAGPQTSAKAWPQAEAPLITMNQTLYSQSAAQVCPVGGTILVDDVPWPTDRSHIEMHIPTEPCAIFTGDRMPMRATFAPPMHRMVFELTNLLDDGQPGEWVWKRTI